MLQSVFTRTLRILFPTRRSAVMSWLPPPAMNLDPLAKSAPDCTSVSTKREISSGRVDPSASIMTMMSPVALANPHAKALPLPWRVWSMTIMSGRSRRATSTVPSVDPPSTRTTWSMPDGSLGSTSAMFSASFSVGMTTLTVALLNELPLGIDPRRNDLANRHVYQPLYLVSHKWRSTQRRQCARYKFLFGTLPIVRSLGYLQY